MTKPAAETSGHLTRVDSLPGLTLQLAWDSAAWAAAVVFAVVLRYEFDWTHVAWRPLAGVVISAIAFQMLFGAVFSSIGVGTPTGVLPRSWL